jgi:predicted transcriptional regulator YheO
MKFLRGRFLRKQLKDIDGLTPLDSQRRQDSWEGVRDLVNKYLQKTDGKFSTRGVNKDFEIVKSVFEKGSKEVRGALNELASIRPETPISEPPGPFLTSLSVGQEQKA